MKPAERQELMRARERADLARMRFANAFDSTLRRITPERLGADAMEAAADRFADLKQHLAQRVMRWPFAVIGLVVFAGVMIFWRPARVALRHGLRLAQMAWAMEHLWRPKK